MLKAPFCKRWQTSCPIASLGLLLIIVYPMKIPQPQSSWMRISNEIDKAQESMPLYAHCPNHKIYLDLEDKDNWWLNLILKSERSKSYLLKQG